MAPKILFMVSCYKCPNQIKVFLPSFLCRLVGASISLQISGGPMFETKTWSHREVNERNKEMSNHFSIFSAAVLLWVMQTSFEAAICVVLLFSWRFSGCSYGNLLIATRDKIFLNCFLCSLQFDAHVRNIANLDFSIYWSFMISAGLELPADLLSIVGLELLGR